jgi:predicted metalloprotease with PDZ domain
VDEYLRLFGGAPKGAYLQALFVSDAEDGEAYRSSSGFRTSVVPGPHNLILWGNQLAHELFHRWIANHGAIAPVSQDDSQWFSEGLSEYYANLALVRVGSIDLEQWIAKAEKHLGLYLYYRSSPAFETSLRAAGAHKGRERLAVYNGGWSAAFCLDVLARRMTGGERGLDDLLAAMWRDFGATGQPYAFDDLPRLFRTATGVDAAHLFAQSIAGTETLPVEECLRDAGFTAGIKGYAAEIWVWPADELTDSQARVRRGLFGRQR